MASPGARLRRYMLDRYLELGLGPSHGFVTDMAKRTGVQRGTMTGWFSRSSAPRLDALGECAKVLRLTRAELVAAFDGQDLITFDRARQIVREELTALGAPTAPSPGPSGERTPETGPRPSGGRAA